MVDVTKAPVIGMPVWPVVGVSKVVHTHGGKAFGASRAAGERYHAGIDILAPKGATVVAVDDGRIVATQPFNGPKAHALLLELDAGPVALYGEVMPGSWTDRGLRVGSRVKRGQPIATIGVNPGGSTMLHFEMYRHGTRANQRWYPNQAPPAALLDPTDYLAAAARGDMVEQESDHDHFPETQKPPGPSMPDELEPVIPPGPSTTVPIGSGGALLAIGVLALLAMAGGRRGR